MQVNILFKFSAQDSDLDFFLSCNELSDRKLPSCPPQFFLEQAHQVSRFSKDKRAHNACSLVDLRVRAKLHFLKPSYSSKVGIGVFLVSFYVLLRIIFNHKIFRNLTAEKTKKDFHPLHTHMQHNSYSTTLCHFCLGTIQIAIIMPLKMLLQFCMICFF